MTRVTNFSAGPAMLPESILAQAQSDLLEWRDHGFSILEANHRGAEFGALLERIESQFRALCAVPDNYQILFLLAPARAHFAAIPLNLSQDTQTADYIVSGLWSTLAAAEAEKYLSVRQHDPFTAIEIPADSAYVYYTDNETVQGIRLPDLQLKHPTPIACDMTSSLLTRPLDINQFGVIFAGVQKNIGPSGLSVAIIRDDLLNQARQVTPSVLDYGLQAQHHSLLNTNNNFAIYMMGLMLDWVQQQGGLAALHERNQQKAALLYQYIDNQSFYRNQVEPAYRSILNVVFQLPNEAMNEAFLNHAKQAGLIGLKGHRQVGGMRASLYNVITLADVEQLIDVMDQFAKQS